MANSIEKIILTFSKLKLAEFREKLTLFSLKLLQTLKTECDKRYYITGEETFEDLKYDILIEILHEKDATFTLEVGTKLREGDNKTKLPFFLGGMDKIKKGEESKLTHWIEKHPSNEYVILEKLNGVSCLIVFNEKDDPKLYTRGDRTEGADISYLHKKIRNIPKVKKNIAVRGEIIIEEKAYQDKWKKQYKTSLSLIVSVVNSKSLKEAIQDLQFVAYEIVVESQSDLTMSEQLLILSDLGFKTPFSVLFEKENMKEEKLSDIFLVQKKTSIFDIDGMVIFQNVKYNRQDVGASGNPNYAFAFKMLLEVVKTHVKYVEWNASKWSVLKPRISIEPVFLSGSKICWATAFNAGFIRDKKINTGSEILITKSGDVIPFIVQVLTESKTPSLPDVPCHWNETNIDLICDNEKDEQVQIQKLIHFFVSINVKQMNVGVLTKLFKSNFDTIYKILSLKKENLNAIPGFGEKMGLRIVQNIDMGIKNMKLSDYMVATCMFGMGFGKRKIESLLQVLPNFLTTSIQLEDICQINGFSKKTAQRILIGKADFLAFHKTIQDLIPISLEYGKKMLAGDQFKDKKVVFSQFRDEALKHKIMDLGGAVTESVSSKTNFVIVKNNLESSSKIEKAKKLNIPIVLLSEFKEKFKL